MQEPGLFALLALAFAQVGQGQVAAATRTYERTREARCRGHSYTRPASAIWRCTKGGSRTRSAFSPQGAAADLTAKVPDKAASKFAALAERPARCGSRRRRRSARPRRRWRNSQAVKIRFLAARVFVEAGAAARRRKRSPTGLAAELQAEPQAYAAIIEGLTALNRRRRPPGDQVVDGGERAPGHLDRPLLSRTRLSRSRRRSRRPTPNSTAASSGGARRWRCSSTRSRRTAIFPPVYYYQGRVREGLKSTKFGESYDAYLAIRGESTDDPLVAGRPQRAAASRVGGDPSSAPVQTLDTAVTSLLHQLHLERRARLDSPASSA